MENRKLMREGQLSEQSHMDSGKMSEEEFYGELKSALAGRLGDGCSLKMREIRKNNGVKYMGLAVRREGRNLAPVICLPELYRKYMEGSPLDALQEEAWEEYVENFDGADIDRRRVTDWQEAKGCLFLKVVSTEMNRGLLETLPHWEILDLSMVMYLKVDGMETGERAYVLVEHELAEKWGQGRDMLYETAVKNTVGAGISFTGISHAITNLLSSMEGDLMLGEYLATRESPLFVLTNHANVFGAVFMVLPQVMEEIADRMGEDVYVIPSSVHEGLVLPVSKAGDLAFLRQLICDVNMMQVPLEERLSDHVYRYSRGKGLSIAV